MSSRRGVLVMAYGTPRNLDDVAAYYTDIRRGRPPPPDLLEELVERYRAIGGSPLLEITEAQARGIEERLGIKSYLGLKHSRPSIVDALREIASDHLDAVVGFVLAPHFSTMSIGDYEARAHRAAEELKWNGSLLMVRHWHLAPGYIDWLARELKLAHDSLPSAVRDEAMAIFTAHSLPEKILAAGDPYPHQLAETAAAVARTAGLNRWRVAWQSAGRTPDPWLGPDLTAVIAELASTGTPGVIVCPCGFVADHLEVLYDVDIEARGIADAVGVQFARTAMPNDNADFLDVAADIVRRALEEL